MHLFEIVFILRNTHNFDKVVHTSDSILILCFLVIRRQNAHNKACASGLFAILRQHPGTSRVVHGHDYRTFTSLIQTVEQIHVVLVQVEAVDVSVELDAFRRVALR